MPATRVVTGVDDRGRPRAEWREEPVTAPQYGHMQPAYDSSSIERRVLTAAEIADRVGRAAAAEARSATPTQKAWNGQSAAMQQSRLNGARRHQEVMAARRPKEEPTVVKPLTSLEELAIASTRAAEARQAKEAADEAWDIAREALDAAMAGVQGLIRPSQSRLGGSVQITSIEMTSNADAPAALPIVHIPAPRAPKNAPGAKVPRQAGHHPAKAGEAAEKAERRRRVMEAMERLGGDQAAVADELGMKRNAVAMVVKFATPANGASA